MIKDPLDKRVYNATLTDKGQQFMADIFPQHASTLEQAFSVLSEEELITIQQAFKIKCTIYWSVNRCTFIYNEIYLEIEINGGFNMAKHDLLGIHHVTAITDDAERNYKFLPKY